MKRKKRFKMESFKKRAGWLLLPAMMVFALYPNFTYAGAVYVGGSNKNLYSDGGGSNDSSNATPSSSNATNFSMGVGAEVNSQTGQVQLNFNNVKLAGRAGDDNIDFGLSNDAGKTQVFNLPIGWKFNIDYVDNSGNYPKLCFGSSMNYRIDNDFTSFDKFNNNKSYKSGLRYYTQEDIKFTTEDFPVKLPYSNPDSQTPLSYKYDLYSKKDMSHEYFDSYGKLICKDYGHNNHVFYNYVNTDPSFPTLQGNVHDMMLGAIIDSYGQKISVKYNGSHNIQITMPDGKKVEYLFSTDQQGQTVISVTDTTGRITTIQYGKYGISEIDYPTGGKIVYSYDPDAIPYSLKGDTPGTIHYFPAVKSVTKEFKGEPSMVTRYNYASNGHDFAYYNNGATYYNDATETGGGDTLTESNNNSYKYVTSVTQERQSVNGGDVTTGQTFNFLHLPLETTVTQNNTQKSRTVITYSGENEQGFNPYDQLKCNDTLPAETEATIGSSSTPAHKIDTTYNSYGQPLDVKQYTKDMKNPSLETVNTYYGEDGNCLLDTKTVKDYVNAVTGEIETTPQSTTTTDNTLSPDKTYIENSTTSKDVTGSNDVSKREVTSTEDSFGRSTEVTYSDPNAQGGADGASTTDAKTSYFRIGNVLTIKTTDALGYSTTEVENIANDHVISKTDAAGNTTRYLYSNNGLTVKTIYPDGSWEQTDSTNPNEVVKTGSNGVTETTYLDGFGRTIAQTSSLYPKTENTATFDGSSIPDCVMSRTYNQMGKVASETDMYGHTTDYVYDDWKGRETSATDYLGNVTTVQYDDADQTSTTYTNGVKSSMSTYDDQGKILSTTDYISGTGNSTPIEVARYNGEKEQISSSLELADSSSAKGANDASSTLMSMTTAYDLNGKPSTINLTAYAGNGSNAVELSGTATCKRDLFGNLKNKVRTYDVVDTNNTHIEKGSGVVTSESKTYDNDGRLETLTDQPTEKYPDGQTIKYTYYPNGQIKTMTDFAGNTFTYTYDSMGRMLTMTGPGISQTNTYYPVASGIKEGKIKTRTTTQNGKTETMSYDYDAMGNLHTVKYPDGKTETMNYDGYGRLQTVTDCAGDTTTYTYEPIDGTHVPTNVQSVSNKLGSVQYTYYTKADGPLFGDGSTVKEADYSNGIAVIYKYYGADVSGQNGSAQNGKAPKLESIEVDSSGGKIMSKSTYTYDPQGRVASIEQSSNIDPDNINCNNTKIYTYNPLNELIKTQVEDNNGNLLRSTDYYYNLNEDLVSVNVTTGSGNNQKAVDSVSYTVNAHDQVTGLSENGKSESFIYDPNGNMTHDGKGNIYIYNKENQLIEFDCNDPNSPYNGLKFGYSYYPDNQREAKWEIGDEQDAITFYYNPDQQIINESQGDQMSTYLMTGGQRIARDVLTAAGTVDPGSEIFYIANAKDITGTIDNTGTKETATYNYTSYGKKLDLKG